MISFTCMAENAARTAHTQSSMTAATHVEGEETATTAGIQIPLRHVGVMVPAASVAQNALSIRQSYSIRWKAVV